MKHRGLQESLTSKAVWEGEFSKQTANILVAECHGTQSDPGVLCKQCIIALAKR